MMGGEGGGGVDLQDRRGMVTDFQKCAVSNKDNNIQESTSA